MRRKKESNLFWHELFCFVFGCWIVISIKILASDIVHFCVCVCVVSEQVHCSFKVILRKHSQLSMVPFSTAFYFFTYPIMLKRSDFVFHFAVVIPFLFLFLFSIVFRSAVIYYASVYSPLMNNY